MRDKLIDILNGVLKEQFDYVPLGAVIEAADALIEKGVVLDDARGEKDAPAMLADGLRASGFGLREGVSSRQAAVGFCDAKSTGAKPDINGLYHKTVVNNDRFMECPYSEKQGNSPTIQKDSGGSNVLGRDGDMQTLWMRVGMSLDITVEDAEVLLGENGDAVRGAEIITKAVQEGRGTLDGDTYVPEDCVRDFNEEYGTDYEPADYGWELYAPLRENEGKAAGAGRAADDFEGKVAGRLREIFHDVLDGQESVIAALAQNDDIPVDMKKELLAEAFAVGQKFYELDTNRVFALKERGKYDIWTLSVFDGNREAAYETTACGARLAEHVLSGYAVPILQVRFQVQDVDGLIAGAAKACEEVNMGDAGKGDLDIRKEM